jgi:hypothetical protein
MKLKNYDIVRNLAVPFTDAAFDLRARQVLVSLVHTVKQGAHDSALL